MTLVALWSGRGSPGVTTAALALAAAWPEGRHVVILEADVAGGELACHRGLWAEPNLVTLAAESRAGLGADRLWAHTQVLGELEVRAVVAPTDPRQVTAAVAALARAGLASDGVEGLDVVVDLGRLDPTGAAARVSASAAFSLALARPSVVDAAHVRERVGLLGREVGLVAVGEGPWSASELASATGTSLVAAVPWDPRGARGVMDGGRSRSLLRSPLLRAMRSLATELVDAAGDSPPAASEVSSGADAAGTNGATEPTRQRSGQWG